MSLSLLKEFAEGAMVEVRHRTFLRFKNKVTFSNIEQLLGFDDEAWITSIYYVNHEAGSIVFYKDKVEVYSHVSVKYHIVSDFIYMKPSFSIKVMSAAVKEHVDKFVSGRHPTRTGRRDEQREKAKWQTKKRSKTKKRCSTDFSGQKKEKKV